MTFGITAFLANNVVIDAILTPEQTTDLLKNIPKFELVEPELAKFYKEMVIKTMQSVTVQSVNRINRLWRWCFPAKEILSFTKEYQTMHFGIIAFISNKEITKGIITSDQISQLLKKIPLYEEPEIQAKFYKELIDFNIQKNIRIQMMKKDTVIKRWWTRTKSPTATDNNPIEEYRFHSDIDVSVSENI